MTGETSFAPPLKPSLSGFCRMQASTPAQLASEDR